jgi:uncharacterized coiled-coil protein SlyX
MPAPVGSPVNQRIEQLEFKVAFLEQANAQLSEELYRQRQEMEALRARLAVLLERLEAAQSQPTQYTPEQEKPPHY